MVKPIVLVAVTDKKESDSLIEFAKKQNQDIDWVDMQDHKAQLAEVAACWNPPQDLCLRFPNLKSLHSIGAGIDNLGALVHSGLQIERMVDEGQKQGMLEYILWGILYYQRDMDRYRAQQGKRIWQTFEQKSAQNTRILILGLGAIGQYVAQTLAQSGYQVFGWSRSQKSIDGVTSFVSQEDLLNAVSDADIVVNLLPLNSQTKAFINQELLSFFNPECALIHCGRGEQLVTKDLIYALENNLLRGAILDVFEQEPLPSHSKLYELENVILTPHIASSASNLAIYKSVCEVAQRMAIPSFIKF